MWFRWFGGWSNSNGKESRRAERGKGVSSIIGVGEDQVRCRLDGLGLSSIVVARQELSAVTLMLM